MFILIRHNSVLNLFVCMYIYAQCIMSQLSICPVDVCVCLMTNSRLLGSYSSQNEPESMKPVTNYDVIHT